jgi:hypothetical protein
VKGKDRNAWCEERDPTVVELLLFSSDLLKDAQEKQKTLANVVGKPNEYDWRRVSSGSPDPLTHW